MRKFIFITSFITILLVSFLGITYSYEYNVNESLRFELIGPSILYIDVGSEYQEYGIKVSNNNVDISSMVKIDLSSLNVFKLGKYKVKYEIDVDGNKEYIYREVIVIDKSIPKIELKGDQVVFLVLGDNYIEEGYVVSDNYDKEIEDKVTISGNIDTLKIGEYRLIYTVTDSSGNINSVIRNVIVQKPEIILE